MSADKTGKADWNIQLSPDATITKVRIYWKQDTSPATPWSQAQYHDVTDGSTNYSIPGLSNSTKYNLKIEVFYTLNSANLTVQSGAITFKTQGPPEEPTNFEGSKHTPSGSSTAHIDLTWNPPQDDGGSPITGYDVRMAGSDKLNWVTIGSNLSPSIMTMHVANVSNHSDYYFAVRAINAFGAGPWEESPLIGLHQVPPKLTGVSAVAGACDADRQCSVTVSWNALPEGNNATSIDVRAQKSGNSTWHYIRDLPLTNTGQQVTVGDPGAYRIEARASNHVGGGEWSDAASVTVSMPPAAIDKISASRGSTGTVTLKWNVPFDGGATITKYEIDGAQYASNGNHQWAVWASSVTPSGSEGSQMSTAVVGIASDNTKSYIARVRATNGKGSSAWTSTAEIKPPVAPGAVSIGGIKRMTNNTEIYITWSGLSNATSYDVEIKSTSATDWTSVATGLTSTDVTATGLDAATTYKLRVRAVNAVGNGAWTTSSDVSPVTQ